MIGGLSGKVAGAFGEGTSDTLAMLLNPDDEIGEYAIGGFGVRSQPYTNYHLTRTYGSMMLLDGEASIHFDGEILAATMWRIIQQFQAQPSLSLDLLLTYFVSGMFFIPSTPSFEHMREGLLAAVRASGDKNLAQCIIWDSFAVFGIGVNAKGTVTLITEDFNLPIGMTKGKRMICYCYYYCCWYYLLS